MPRLLAPPRLRRLAPDDPERVGPYRVVGRIAGGGMGTVFAVHAEGLQGYLALKLINAEYADSPDFRRSFAREAGLMARVNSPGVPRFVAADVEADPPWIATEFVPGTSLRRRVERRGALRGARLRGLALGLAEALHAVHGAGVVHRDLKPSNVVLAPKGPKLLDFGIAVAEEDPTLWLRLRRMRRRARSLGIPDPPQRPLRHGSGSGIRADRRGTPGWTSPEQYRGQAPTERSDVFLWGGVVAFAAARRDPFGTASAQEMARRVLSEQPDLAGLPDGLADLVRLAMAKAPEDRPDSAELLQRVTALSPYAPAESGDPVAAARRALQEEWAPIAVELPRPPRAPLWRARDARES
jgi:eukaryotic-like serine/threonine-protein kinase